jgi:hypothetical protein
MFSASQILSGIDIQTYNQNTALNEEVIIVAIVACMPGTGVASRDITHLTAIAGTSTRKRLLRSSVGSELEREVTQSSSSIEISYKVQFYNPSLTYAQVAYILTTNVNDGIFDQALSQAALQYEATDLVGVTSSSIQTSNSLPADNVTMFTIGGIVGIVIAGVFLLSVAAAVVYWFVYMKKSMADLNDTFTALFGGFTSGSQQNDHENQQVTEKAKNKEKANGKESDVPASNKKSKAGDKQSRITKFKSDTNLADDVVVTTENVLRDRLTALKKKEMPKGIAEGSSNGRNNKEENEIELVLFSSTQQKEKENPSDIRSRDQIDSGTTRA